MTEHNVIRNRQLQIFKALHKTISEFRTPAYLRALSRIRMVIFNRPIFVQWRSETGSEIDLREKNRDRQADKQKQTDK